MNIRLLLTAKTVITHMSESKGNVALLNTVKRIHEGNLVSVPVLSGNSLRHNLFRRSGADVLLEVLGLENKLSNEALHVLYNGGVLNKSKTTYKSSEIHDLYDLFPFFKVLGGSFFNRIIDGHLYVGFGNLICKENSDLFKADFPLRSMFDYIDSYQYTRADHIQGEKELTTKMIYNGQAVKPGSAFVCDCFLENMNEIDLGFVYSALRRFNQNPVIGGMKRIGHGRLDVKIFSDTNFDFEEEYISFLHSKKKEIEKWLMDFTN